MAINIPQPVSSCLEFWNTTGDSATFTNASQTIDLTTMDLNYPALLGVCTAAYVDVIINKLTNTNVGAANGLQIDTILEMSPDAGENWYYCCQIDSRYLSIPIDTTIYTPKRFCGQANFNIAQYLNKTAGGYLIFRFITARAQQNNLVLGELQTVLINGGCLIA
jgi:hypothetical protein